MVKTEADAVAKLISGNLIPNCTHINSQAFRDGRYWNEECDNIFKSHYSLFEHLYSTRSGAHSLPGEKSYVRSPHG